ncbi:MAG: hypothetical protein HQL40_00575 [Alphaproteobacteria bacterium]|nr:hypothetical protein [Alphaproteobacteria bacterium]
MRLAGLLVMATLTLVACGSDADRQFPTVAHAPPQAAAPITAIPQPAYQPGQRWTYSDGYDLKVVSVTDGLARIERQDLSDTWYVKRAFFVEESQGSEGNRRTVFWSQDPMKVFQLRPGEAMVTEQEYLRNGELVRHVVSWTLEGRQRLRVPAGEFDAWVFVSRARNLKTGWTAYEKHWYAPDVGNFIRTEHRYGNDEDGARVLMASGVEPVKKKWSLTP